jgi:RhtB (resistance to homoserine/threonine) family protein
VSGGYWVEFGQVAVAHLLAVASPGPDFAIVLKQSLTHGRRTAVWTSIGVGTAILLHVTYSLLGIGLLVAGSPLWFDAVKYAGAAYLAWIGVQALRARPRAAAPGGGESVATPGDHSAFVTGFLTNALNPKASLFFIALFSVVINPQRTPRLVQAGYGVWMALVTMGWFTMVSLVFTRENVRRVFLSHGHWIDRALGVVFLALALSLALASMR